jgi:hypothetical protein
VTLRLPLACTVALLAPIAVVAAGIVATAAGERAGLAPFAGLVARNSAEAAAMGHAAEMLRLLKAGEDPRRVYPVRAEIISSAVLQATTLEAALWSRQLEMVRLLDRQGAIDGDGQRRALACLAVDLDLGDVAEYLTVNGGPPCEPGQALARVIARTNTAGGGQ